MEKVKFRSRYFNYIQSLRKFVFLRISNKIILKDLKCFYGSMSSRNKKKNNIHRTEQMENKHHCFVGIYLIKKDQNTIITQSPYEMFLSIQILSV